MGHFESKGDKQVYVGEDGKVYVNEHSDVVLYDSSEEAFGESPKEKRITDRIQEAKNCTICGQLCKSGAGMSAHMRKAHQGKEA